MGYILVAVAILFGVTKGFCGKKTSGALVHTSDAMLANMVRMLFCILVGVVILAFQGGLVGLFSSPYTIAIAALSGLGTAAFTVSWLLSIRQGAYMMVDVFLVIGVILPLVLCELIYGEKIKLLQWGGIALLLLAGYIMCSYSASIKGRISPKAFFLLALCALSNGVVDFSQKMFMREVPGGSVATFNLYTYFFTGLILTACFLFVRSREKKTAVLAPAKAIVMPILGYIAVMAVCLFLSSYFKTQAAQYLDAALIYPLSQGGSVMLSTAMSVLFFKEKITPRGAIGIALSFVALLMINVLAEL